MHLGVLVRCSAGDLDLDELGRAFAITYDLMGEVQHDRFQRLGKGGIAGGIHPRRTGCAEHEAVRGRGVAVDGDAVEAAIANLAEQRLKGCLLDPCIGEDIDQHRRHVRGNHARALGDTRDLHGLAVDLHRGAGPLGKGVRGHDRLGGPFECRRIQPGSKFGDLCNDAVMRQGFADDAGRGGKDTLGREPRGIGDRSGDFCHGSLPVVPGKGVGISGVHQDGGTGAGVTAKFLLAIQYGRGASLGPCEDPGHRGARIHHRQHHIGATLVFDPGRGRGKAHALDLGEVGETGRGQR